MYSDGQTITIARVTLESLDVLPPTRSQLWSSPQYKKWWDDLSRNDFTPYVDLRYCSSRPSLSTDASTEFLWPRAATTGGAATDLPEVPVLKVWAVLWTFIMCAFARRTGPPSHPALNA